MIDINELYENIAKDLSILKYENETTQEYRYRLVYSGLSKWILTLFSDRDFENTEIDQISKSHVTISAMNILKSYFKIDENLKCYFLNDKEFINSIEDLYIRVGYVKSGIHSFKPQGHVTNVYIADQYLVINAETKIRKMIGAGLWTSHANNAIELNNYLLIDNNSEDYARKIISQLHFSKFDPNLGKNEIYNVEKHRWEYYSDKLALKYDLSIIKVDDGFDYKVLKKVDDDLYSASLPTIYSKRSTDYIFYHEVWRIILGICSINKNKAKCIMKTEKDCIKYKFYGFILPALETSLLKCMSWPLGNSQNISAFVTDLNMKQAINKVLDRFSIEIMEGE